MESKPYSPMRICLLLPVVGAFVLAGCGGGGTESVSDPKYYLGKLSESWKEAREALESGSSDLKPFFFIRRGLSDRTRNKLEDDYKGSNKDEVMAKFDAVREAYEKTIASKLNIGRGEVTVRRGVKLTQVKAAFDALDADVKALVKMTG